MSGCRREEGGAAAGGQSESKNCWGLPGLKHRVSPRMGAKLGENGSRVGGDMLRVKENLAATHSLSCLLWSSKQASRHPPWAVCVPEI